MSDSTLATRYNALEAEPIWYKRWEDAGLFKPSGDAAKPVFTITIPPPNITGSLHMGHALCYPIQDLLGRYKRLRGYSVLILPGQDHAGIATQSVVEKNLRKEGLSGAQLGRDKFIERVWQWREESGNTILNQFRSLGCAFDWDRSRFTLDSDYAQAVLKVFIDWYNRGLIYRGKRVVNWDPVLQTSVSDIETERKTIKGKLYHVRYPFSDGSGEVVIATTRPETMLADVAVAVHPSDERYKGLVGKSLVLPLLNREIPLIEDLYPDPEFGTGAVKITPAHDPNDYEVGVRHGLEMPVVLDERAKVTELGGTYAGLDRYEARKRIVADLEEQGFLVRVDDYDISVLVSDRSKEVIEPLLSEQWFVKQTALAEKAAEVVKNGTIRFHPERYKDIYLAWMDNIRDWNISRQLWWGHRIPIYYSAGGSAYAALSWDEAQAQAGDDQIISQDNDVLDTWFSSGLWPFATLGWPNETEDLKRFYPTSVLVTDRNILYLWVARMVMMGLDLLGEIPYHDVMIFATVLTEDGRRMSKSLGTGVDPMTIIDTLGADALRWTLLSQTGSNQDIRYSERKTEEARNFANKIWNATRFVLMNTDGEMPPKPSHFEEVDRWLLSRLFRTEEAVRGAFEAYDIQLACQSLYRFFWSEICDWYIEVSKSRLADPSTRATPQWVLLTSIEAFLKMLHPVMPYLTEELYAHLPVTAKAQFIMASEWPEIDPSFDQPESETKIERAFEITRSLRALRAELGLAAMKSIPEAWYEGDLTGVEEIVRTQAWIEILNSGRPSGNFVSASVAGVDAHVPVGDLVDREKECARLAKESEKLELELSKLEQRLSDPNFTERAKPEIVQRERARSEELRNNIVKTKERKTLFGC